MGRFSSVLLLAPADFGASVCATDRNLQDLFVLAGGPSVSSPMVASPADATRELQLVLDPEFL